MKNVIEKLTVAALYRRPDACAAWDYLSGFSYPWQALDDLKEEILRVGETLSEREYCQVERGVWIAKSAKVASSALIQAPCIIGESTEVRQGAFIRGSALVGRGCVVGNSTELKNCILFDGAQVPHYNYVGDSILGYCAHMGAGAVTSNVKGDKSLVTVQVGDERLETGRRKFGAMLGDHAEIGCHAVLNPGSVIGVGSRVYPLSFVRGYLEEGTIQKQNGERVKIK